MLSESQETPNHTIFEQQKFAYEMLRKEIELRREKA
jgi:hypothetical protein